MKKCFVQTKNYANRSLLPVLGEGYTFICLVGKKQGGVSGDGFEKSVIPSLVVWSRRRYGQKITHSAEKSKNETSRERPKSAPYRRLKKTRKRKPLFLQLETTKALKKLKIEKNNFRIFFEFF